MAKENAEIKMEEITKRLDVMIYLLLEQKRQAGVPKKQIINELANLGLKDWEIARILGKTRGYVSSELTQIKKPNKKRGGEKRER